MQKIITYTNKILAILIIGVMGLIGMRMLNPEFLSGMSKFNEPPAIIATFLLLAVLYPGMLQRMGMPARLLKYPVIWRRTLGITMYLAALVHFLFLIDYLPWFSDGLIKNLDALTASGICTIVLLLPVLLTSNNASVRFLGKRWKLIQRTTYLILPLITVHLYKTGETPLMILYVITCILIITSYFMKVIKKGTSPVVTAVVASAVIAFALGFAYLLLQLLFKNAHDEHQKELLQDVRGQNKELKRVNEELKEKIRHLEE